MLEASQIRRYYRESFQEQEWHQHWEGLWRKQYKLRLSDGRFLALNKLRPRLSFNSLKKYLIQFAPVNVYQSVLNWLRPSHVSYKNKSQPALPLPSEYVVDVDHYLRYRPHRHDLLPDRICLGCLETAKELAMEILDVIMENHSDVHTVFSGHRGFHLHVLDFDVRDYTIYMPSNPLKSHEVARFLYTERLKERVPDCFDGPHFIVSCDVTRVITVPESLNAVNGLVASYLGTAHDFMELSVEDIVSMARSKKHITEGLKWITADTWKNPRFNLLRSSL